MRSLMIVLLVFGLASVLAVAQESPDKTGQPIAVAIVRAVHQDVKDLQEEPGNVAQIKPGVILLDDESFSIAAGQLEDEKLPQGLTATVGGVETAGVETTRGHRVKDDAVFVVLESLDETDEGYSATVRYMYNVRVDSEAVSCRVLRIGLTRQGGSWQATDKEMIGAC